MSTDTLESKVGTMLEASNVKKSMAIPYFMIGAFIQYLLFLAYFTVYPSSYLNSDIFPQVAMFEVVVLIIAGVMVLSQHRLEQSAKAQLYAPYFASFFYVSVLMVMGYLTGHMSIATGFVMAGAPLIAIILFDKYVVISIIALGISIFALISAANIVGVIPYAPLFASEITNDMYARAFMQGCMLFFMLPYLIGFTITTYLLIKYWRLREDDIRRMSVTDSLIGMANRRAICDYLVDEQHSLTPGHPLSIILVDVDFFKKVNDTYGHTAGDMVLCRVGDVLKAPLRSTDQAGRYGGEEFLIVLPNTTLQQAVSIAERCRVHLEQEKIWSTEGLQISVTASFGVYSTTDKSELIQSMMQKVDVQLYKAKENGRNQVCADM